ncbi:acyltransferase [Azospirillum sp. SYSU D00513]|uniref:acyltransferase family protein n=1 Tax=Azospirillum sp. SYSU D00513 TaxID=2812561 RepID=UPI001A957EC8|nr:acyltransferase [Azospirillum sp. SYSU D00513]
MSQEIRSLTGLRGVAAITPLLLHYGHSQLDSGPVHDLFIRGSLGVDLFFILSGFVMAVSYSKYFGANASLDHYLSFLWKRLARVYPLYFMITAGVVLLDMRKVGLEAYVELHGLDILANLLLVHNWGIGTESLLEPSWSISTEFAAYLLFPLLLGLCVFGGWRATAAMLALSAAGLAFVAFSGLGRPATPLDVVTGDSVLPLLRCLSGFCIGLICYRLHKHPLAKAWLSGSLVTAAVLSGLALAFAVEAHDLVIYAFYPVLIINACQGSRLCDRIFANRLSYHLGVISYSMYLVHVPVLGKLLPRVDALLGVESKAVSFVLFLAIVWALSWLLFHLVEKPGRDFFQKLGSTPRGTKAKAAAV